MVVGVGAEAAVDVFKEQAEAAVEVSKVECAREVDKSEADTAVVEAKGWEIDVVNDQSLLP